MNNKFELLLFYSNFPFTSRCVDAGIDMIIIDWESKGKELRQKLYDTQINRHSFTDLKNVKSRYKIPIIVRVNEFSNLEKLELEKTIELGADEILLPMVKKPKEVEGALRQINGKTQLGILIETNSAVKMAKDLASFPLSRVYVGLNDLSIERNLSNIFMPVYDGTIDKIREHFDIPFGFGGLTHPKMGYPIPCEYLMKEMMRLNCTFSFLRRSFMKDAIYKEHIVIEDIKKYFNTLSQRTSIEINEDRKVFTTYFEKEIALI